MGGAEKGKRCCCTRTNSGRIARTKGQVLNYENFLIFLDSPEVSSQHRLNEVSMSFNVEIL